MPDKPEPEGRRPDPECDFDYGDYRECWQCAGEGHMHDCWDGFCQEAEIGCEMCTKKCDVCEGEGGWEVD